MSVVCLLTVCLLFVCLCGLSVCLSVCLPACLSVVCLYCLSILSVYCLSPIQNLSSVHLSFRSSRPVCLDLYLCVCSSVPPSELCSSAQHHNTDRNAITCQNFRFVSIDINQTSTNGRFIRVFSLFPASPTRS